MKESNIQTLFSKYLEANRPEGPRAYELKLCKGTSLAFNAVREHQVEALVAAATAHGLYHKITDQPVSWTKANTRFNRPKPFDCFFISRAKAYIAICFYVPRKPKKLIMINIFDWNRCKGVSERKSITKEMAIEIAEEIITL